MHIYVCMCFFITKTSFRKDFKCKLSFITISMNNIKINLREYEVRIKFIKGTNKILINKIIYRSLRGYQ